jgi:imidazolonepropionase-like amidohydrolase
MRTTTQRTAVAGAPARGACLAAILALITLLGAAPSHGLGDLSAWKNPVPAQPEALLVRNATLWTQGPQGRIQGDLLVQRGKIAQVGNGLQAPAGAVVIDATGKHVTPGIIDAHSHIAISGGVNEGSHIVTAEVRIVDVLNSEDVNIYRQLAGGVTAANLLHGSANAIGGQNAVIKMRWGAPPDGLLFEGAPEGIKFALGENPKQSNWNVDQRRFPQTRPGVEAAIEERFEAALAYRQHWEEHRAAARRDPHRVPPRRDLQLEAVLEILDGQRLVHAHSYRADEILMLIRLAEEHGFQIASFQHVLEGYKVADEIAAHGAGASTFSDWWAFKFEVIDAIPHNATLMTRRGVDVSLNSDSAELARRLNLEAAKAVRYGGLGEEEALALVTTNPARQLGIDHRVGTLARGKDADFVLWSGHPLDNFSVAEQTWIDGRKYFDRQEDLARREALTAEREALLHKVRADLEPAESEEPESEAEEDDEPEPADVVPPGPVDQQRRSANAS